MYADIFFHFLLEHFGKYSSINKTNVVMHNNTQHIHQVLSSQSKGDTCP